MGLEGITSKKVNILLGEFLKITKKVGQISGTNNLIIANAFLHLGKLLYFKNSSVQASNALDNHDNYPTWLQTKSKIIDKKFFMKIIITNIF